MFHVPAHKNVKDPAGQLSLPKDALVEKIDSGIAKGLKGSALLRHVGVKLAGIGDTILYKEAA